MDNGHHSLKKLQEAVGLRFNDFTLIQRAFVHRSYLHEADDDSELQDNQRLEFLGDAVLSFIVSELLFRLYPERREGELTNLRSGLVRRESLSRFARELCLGNHLLLGRGEEENGGRIRHTTLCDTYEAFIGALYLDQGIDVLRGFLEPRLLKEIERVAHFALAKDPKSRLQEWVQAAMGQTPRYRTVHTEGPDHARKFIRQVTIDKQPYGVGEGPEQAGGRAGRRGHGPGPPGADKPGLRGQWSG